VLQILVLGPGWSKSMYIPGWIGWIQPQLCCR